MTKNGKGFNLSFFVILVIMFLMMYMGNMNSTEETYTSGALVTDLTEGNVSSVSIQPNEQTPTGSARVVLKGGVVKTLYVTDVNDLQETLNQYGIDPVVKDVPKEGWFEAYGMPILLALGVGFLIIYLMNMQAGGGGGGNAKMMNFGKSRAKMTHGDEKINLGSVAGLKEEKEDLEEIVEFLKEPGKFTSVGARIPKGVLLEGPPGTGKTLLAKAVAGEANVPFFSISGSDFVEMFVGVGASRVRDLFEDAKKNAPCIVFIDEIDAVARRRGTGMGGGHDERYVEG